MSEFENQGQNPMLNNYLIYTDEQMAGFIMDGIMHKTIREIIRSKNISALHDLIIYTDTNDPDILSDSLNNNIAADDLLWFITNRDVIKTMYQATYTNILSNIFYDWNHKLESPETLNPHKIIKAILGLFDTDAEDYKEVIDVWLTYENMVELFDFLSELDTKIVLLSGADTDLFQLLELILLTKIKLVDGDISKIPCFYTTEVQTYLDMLGNYIMPHIKPCDPMIVRAYDAMRQYLVASENVYTLGIHFRIYIQFANKFHDTNREIFRQICQVIRVFPEFIQFTTEYGGIGLFIECCRFDMPEELISLLTKYDIKPAQLGDDLTNYRILAKIFYTATQPEPRPQIHETLLNHGYFSAYIEWFNISNLEDLRLIDTCAWPLNAILDDNLTPYPAQDLINLKAYDSPALLLQFLTLNDLTNTGEIQAEQTVKIVKILKDTNLTTRLFDTDTHIVSEIIKHLRTTNGIFNSKLVRNKLVKLMALENQGFISLEVYKHLEKEVFAKYIHSFDNLEEQPASNSRYELQSLLDEYKPNYTPNYWEALIKSALKANSGYTKTVIEILKTNYTDLAQQIAPEPQMLLEMLHSNSVYQHKCEPESLIAKFAMILVEFYTEAELDHNHILNQLVQMPISRLAFSNTNYISIITTILIYTSNTSYGFQLNETIIDKIIHQMSELIQKPLPVDVYCNTFSFLFIIIEKHCDRVSAKKLMLGYLTELFTVNENIITSNANELCIMNDRLTHKYCEYVASILDGIEYTADISQNETTGKLSLIIRPSNIFIETIQNSRWRNWCASRQIPYCTTDLTLLTDPNTAEFICPITFEPQKTGDKIITLTGCGHKFSTTGIIEWFRTKNTCPMCRANVADGKLSGANCEMLELV